VTWNGYCVGDKKEVDVYQRNWAGTEWKQIGTIVGRKDDKAQEETFFLTTTGTDINANAGNVRIRFYNNDTLTSFATDRILFSYAVVGQSAGYSNGSIWVDTTVSNESTTPYTDGVADNPVSTWAAALTLSASLGINQFNIASGSTITLSGDTGGMVLLGHGWNLALNSKAIAAAYFEGASVSGIGTGDDALFVRCHFPSTSTLDTSRFRDCGFSGTFTMTAGSHVYNLIDCHDHDATTTGNPEFVFAADVDMAARYWAGGMKVSAMVDGNYATLDGHGRLVIGDDSTGGTITLRGHWPPVAGGSGLLTAVEFRALASTPGVLTETQRFGTDQTFDTDVIGVAGTTINAVSDMHLVASDVWSVTARTLTADTNINYPTSDENATAVAAAVPTSDANATAIWAKDARTLTADTNIDYPSSDAIADAVLKTDVSDVQDTASKHSLATIVLATLESAMAGSTWTIRKTTGDTFTTKTITSDADASPIVSVT